MTDVEFNLLHEPWIKVMKHDGKTDELSLLQLFEQAHQWKGLSGELPTQDIAVLRLLLAILHAVFGRYDINGDFAPPTSPKEAIQRWKALWDRGSLPMGIIKKYLLHYEDRFWLFHPKFPFYQVAIDSKEITPTEKKASFLIGDLAESDNKIRLFSSRTQKDTISYSEAVRWLLYTNSFDVAPGGKPAHGSIKGYGLSWLGKLGLIWADGSNFFETLLLNFVMATEKNIWSDWDVIWEQGRVCDEEDLKAITPIFPQNPCGLLTMQFRRIQLIRNVDSKRVEKFLLWSGQLLDEENAVLEQMTLWKKNKNGGYTPKKHEASRQIWRDFSAILSSASDTKATAGVIEWIGWLRENNVLKMQFVRLNTAGVTYKNNTAIIDIFADGLRVNLLLLTKLGSDWVNRIANEIDVTEHLVEEVGRFAVDIYKSLGYKNSTKSDRELLYRRKNDVKEQAYYRLDRPFRRWLEELYPEQDCMNEACERWWLQAKHIVRGLGNELVQQSGPQSFVGRIMKDGGEKRLQRYTAPEAYNRFLYRTSTREPLQRKEG